jgi:hypothetical protein
MANRIKLAGTTANTFDIGINLLSLSATQVSTPYTLLFPGNVGSANTFLKNDGTGNLSWSTAGSGNSIENGTSNVKINSSGSPVAISVNGTSNVAVFNQSSANITGNLSVSGNASTANLSATTQITRNSRNVPVFVYQANTAPANPLVGDQWYDTNTGTLFEYLNDDTSAAWIDMNGNPGSLVNLTVNGTASFSNISVSGTVTAGNLNSTGTYSTVIGGTNRDVYVDDTGLLGYVSSIKASKANIEPLADTNWLLQLNAVSFNRRKKDDKGKYTKETYKELEYGLIAEEVEAVNDVLCFYDREENKRTGKTKDKLAGVNYGKLVVPLLKLVQEQQAMIKDLSSRLTEIENNNSDKNKSE